MALTQGSSTAPFVEKSDGLSDSYVDLGMCLVRSEENSRASSPDLLSFSVLSLGIESVLEADQSEDAQAKGLACQSATQKLLFTGGELTKACREAAYERAADIVGTVAAGAAQHSKVFAAKLVEVVATSTKTTTNVAVDNANGITTPTDGTRSTVAMALVESTRRVLSNVSTPAAATILSGPSYVASIVASKVGNWTTGIPSGQDSPLTASWASLLRPKSSKPCLSSRKYKLITDSEDSKAGDNSQFINSRTNESVSVQGDVPGLKRCATDPALFRQARWVRQELHVVDGRHSHGFEKARRRRQRYLAEHRREVLEAEEEQREDDGEYADVKRHPAFNDDV